MNYNIILDEKILIDFINFLPDLNIDEQYYVCLFGRKKYAPNSDLTNEKSQLKRFTSTKDRLFDKIKQLECAVGSYKSPKGIPIPQESLALYITPNPRNLFKASKETAKTLVDRICDNNLFTTNPKSLALDKIQVSCTRKIYYDFELDGKIKDGISIRDYLLPNYIYTIIETRGGYHILINLIEMKNNKKWYQEVSNNLISLKEKFNLNLDVSGDILLPIPGTSQGGFCPKFI